MDELASALEGAAVSSFAAETIATRKSQYKSHRAVMDQASRRSQMLKQQREERQDRMNSLRHLGELDDSQANELEPEEEVTHMDEAVDPAAKDASTAMSTKADKAKSKRANSVFKRHIMLPEVMFEAVDEWSEWSCVPCPVGNRVLVVSSKGRTKAFPHYQAVHTFQSLLPAGGMGSHRSKDYCVLDAIFDKVNNIYWVLDILCWKGTPVVETDFECRTFWLNSKLSEEPGLMTTESQKYSFQPLPRCESTPEAIHATVIAPRPWHLEGLLFYHNEGFYEAGVCPLVLWLEYPHIKPALAMDINPKPTD